MCGEVCGETGQTGVVTVSSVFRTAERGQNGQAKEHARCVEPQWRGRRWTRKKGRRSNDGKLDSSNSIVTTTAHTSTATRKRQNQQTQTTGTVQPCSTHRMVSNHESTSLALRGAAGSTSRGGGGTLSTIAFNTFMDTGRGAERVSETKWSSSTTALHRRNNTLPKVYAAK